jgi:hypothetical protein
MDYTGIIEVDWILERGVQNSIPFYYYVKDEDGNRVGQDVSDRSWRAYATSTSKEQIDLVVDTSRATEGIIRVIMTTGQADAARFQPRSAAPGSAPEVGRYYLDTARKGEDFEREARGVLRMG